MKVLGGKKIKNANVASLKELAATACVSTAGKMAHNTADHKEQQFKFKFLRY